MCWPLVQWSLQCPLTLDYLQLRNRVSISVTRNRYIVSYSIFNGIPGGFLSWVQLALSTWSINKDFLEEKVNRIYYIIPLDQSTIIQNQVPGLLCENVCTLLNKISQRICYARCHPVHVKSTHFSFKVLMKEKNQRDLDADIFVTADWLKSK